MIKYIAAAAGFWFLGKSILGAILGFALGSFLDNYFKVMSKVEQEGGQSGRRGFSAEDLFSYYQQQSSANDIPTMLMALSATVMKADGKSFKV